jgi:uncharacterized membrane protein
MISSHHSDQTENRANGGRSSRITGVVAKNISEIVKMRAEKEREKGLQERLADLLTRFSGSMLFVYVHAFWFAVWIVFNTGLLGQKPFDPFPFSLLTLIVSLEAIFLSTFVLISQNHAGRIADKRADLDLQINLLAEHEVTRLLKVTDAVAEHLGIEIEEESEHAELKEDVGAREVLDEIETRERNEHPAEKQK